MVKEIHIGVDATRNIQQQQGQQQGQQPPPTVMYPHHPHHHHHHHPHPCAPPPHYQATSSSQTNMEAYPHHHSLSHGGPSQQQQQQQHRHHVSFVMRSNSFERGSSSSSQYPPRHQHAPPPHLQQQQHLSSQNNNHNNGANRPHGSSFHPLPPPSSMATSRRYPRGTGPTSPYKSNQNSSNNSSNQNSSNNNNNGPVPTASHGYSHTCGPSRSLPTSEQHQVHSHYSGMGQPSNHGYEPSDRSNLNNNNSSNNLHLQGDHNEMVSYARQQPQPHQSFHNSTHAGPPPRHTSASAYVPHGAPPRPASSSLYVQGPAPPRMDARSCLPLQPVVHNSNNHWTPHDRKKMAAAARSIAPVASQENPAATQQHQQQTTANVNVNVNPLVMKSPVTLCFERMLGAAEYLAQHPTPKVHKKLPESTSKKRKEEAALSMLQAATTLEQYEAFQSKVEQDETTTASKRAKVARTMPIGKPQTASLEPGNPFWELEQDEELLSKVILQMALISESKDSKRTVSEPVSTTITEGFYWRDYPVLEEMLFDNMKNYYLMSSQNRQSRHQQEFNNRLVASIRQTAKNHGYDFDPAFNDKRLRDRVRCFFKTHLQNAKKRLATLQKHPHSPIHQSHLRIYIRCVQENMSVAESEALESSPTLAAPPAVVVRSRDSSSEEPVRECI